MKSCWKGRGVICRELALCSEGADSCWEQRAARGRKTTKWGCHWLLRLFWGSQGPILEAAIVNQYTPSLVFPSAAWGCAGSWSTAQRTGNRSSHFDSPGLLAGSEEWCCSLPDVVSADVVEKPWGGSEQMPLGLGLVPACLGVAGRVLPYPLLSGWAAGGFVLLWTGLC